MEEQLDMQVVLMPNEMPENHLILWNMGCPTTIKIDKFPFEINQYCMVFLSELHLTVSGYFEKVRTIEFSKSFIGIDSSQNQVGDFLQVFYGFHFLDNVSKIELNQNQFEEFDSLWNVMSEDMNADETLISKPFLRYSF